ncbi:MAG: amidohydrolase family protein [Planctomycetaceae bacterium]
MPTRRDFAKTVAVAAAGSLFGGFNLPRLFAGQTGGPMKASKYIDVHTHVGVTWNGQKELTPELLVEWMDAHDVEKAVVLPLTSPEASAMLQTTETALDAARKFPDRLIPFCSIDPRQSVRGGLQGFIEILREWKERGAKGFGEHKVGLPFDDPLMMRVYAACEEVGLPLLFHIDGLRGMDQPGLPRLENALKTHPNLTFIGHGPGWWASISGDAKQADGYPRGPVAEGGAIDRLMEKYPNIHGDLSANSGASSISRDKEFGKAFMIRRQDRLMFGTDYLAPGQGVPQFDLFDSLDLPADVRAKIYRGNAERVLKLS